jgi:hypothetical protein
MGPCACSLLSIDCSWRDGFLYAEATNSLRLYARKVLQSRRTIEIDLLVRMECYRSSYPSPAVAITPIDRSRIRALILATVVAWSLSSYTRTARQLAVYKPSCLWILKSWCFVFWNPQWDNRAWYRVQHGLCQVYGGLWWHRKFWEFACTVFEDAHK